MQLLGKHCRNGVLNPKTEDGMPHSVLLSFTDGTKEQKCDLCLSIVINGNFFGDT